MLREARWPLGDVDASKAVDVVAATVITAQLLFRAWAIYGGWFYSDDFEFLYEASGTPLSLSYLLEPHDSQFMPGGLLLIWLVANAGPFEWGWAATVLILWQAAASILCWLMLRELFGSKPILLWPLLFYLSSPLSITGFMWFASGVNQIPLHACFFAAVILHVRYLRTRRRSYALLTALVLAIGLAFYVKVILIPITLAFLALFYFTAGSFPSRVRQSLREYWFAWVCYAALLGLFTWYYVENVPNPVRTTGQVDYAGLLDTLIHTSLAVGSIGGPWVWSLKNPPLGQVATPAWAVTLAWVVIAIFVLWRVRFHKASWQAGYLAAAYLAIAWLLLAHGRVVNLGSAIGFELRYLADATVVLTLCLALFLQPLKGRSDIEDGGQAESPRVVPDRVSYALLAALLAGALWSNVAYVNFWRDDFPARLFITNAISEAERKEGLAIADEPVPELVMNVWSYPSNLPSRLLAPLGNEVDVTTVGNDLAMLDPVGIARQAIVAADVTAPAGPVADCGYLLSTGATTIDLSGRTRDYFWWASLSYVSDSDGRIGLSVGNSRYTAPIERGLHTLFVQGEGAISPVKAWVTDPDTTVCLDRITMGDLDYVAPGKF